MIGARVGDRGETRPCHLASAARRPRRGRTRTRARALATEGYAGASLATKRGLAAEKSPKNGSRALSAQGSECYLLSARVRRYICLYAAVESNSRSLDRKGTGFCVSRDQPQDLDRERIISILDKTISKSKTNERSKDQKPAPALPQKIVADLNEHNERNAHSSAKQ